MLEALDCRVCKQAPFSSPLESISNCSLVTSMVPEEEAGSSSDFQDSAQEDTQFAKSSPKLRGCSFCLP